MGESDADGADNDATSMPKLNELVDHRYFLEHKRADVEKVRNRWEILSVALLAAFAVSGRVTEKQPIKLSLSNGGLFGIVSLIGALCCVYAAGRAKGVEDVLRADWKSTVQEIEKQSIGASVQVENS